jgi:2-keto-4-pentenoate hydratase/2-oxohepta-3-ene-1,7-dioic acid hydratase in catechol pathway
LKLARYREDDQVRWGAIDAEAETVRRLRGSFAEWAPRITVDGPAAAEFAAEPVPIAGVQLLAPLEPTAEITGTGVNYPEWTIPFEGADSPFYFRAQSAICGPDDELRYPALIQSQTQCRFCYEIELVGVFGAPVSDRKQGTRSLLGYTVGNDGCLRAQRPGFLGMDLVGSKDGFRGSSVGPWITTLDELGGTGQPELEMEMRINGVVTQRGNTGDMNSGMDELIRELSWRMEVGPGDILYTGTCGYVGIPDGFWEPGDNGEAEIEGIGVLRNTIESRDPYAAAA